MFKTSLIRVSFVGAGNIFNSLLGFAFLAAIAKLLPIESFGKYALVTSLLLIISKIMDFGTNSVFVSRSISKSEDLVNKFLSLKFVLFLVTIPLAIITLTFFKLAQTEILLLFLIGLFSYGINYSLFGLFQKTQKFRLIVLVNTLPAIVKGLFAFLIFTKIINPSFTQAFGIFSLSVFSSAVLLLFIRTDLKIFRFTLGGLKEIFSQSFPAGISLIISDGWSAISNGVAKLAGSFASVGIFSLADKISNIFSQISLAVFTVFLPKNAIRKKEKLNYDFKEAALISIFIGMLSIAAVFAAQIFIKRVFDQKFDDSLKILDILIFASAITAIYSFMKDYFFVYEKSSTLFPIISFKVLSFFIFCIILIPAQGLYGLALANLFSSIGTLGITCLLILKANYYSQN